MERSPSRRARIFELVFVEYCVPSARGQVTDPEGFITFSNWLVVGPFTQTLGCATDEADELLSNFTAPASIPCEYPAAGDEIEYDSFLAASVEYIGPLSESFLPFWRPFQSSAQDSTDDATVDLLGDDAFECQRGDDGVCANFVSWVATYVVYKGDSPIDVELCVGTSDAGQMWLYDTLVLNRGGCRRHSLCGETVPATITPGPHRIALASFFSGANEWQVSLAIRRDGAPIRDDDPDWSFAGTARPDFAQLPDCPEVVAPVSVFTCDVTNGDESRPRRFRRGNVNADTLLNLSDAVGLLEALSRGGRASTCGRAADANDDSLVNLSDALAILDHLFRATGPLAEPFELCGVDATADRLTCRDFAPCQ